MMRRIIRWIGESLEVSKSRRRLAELGADALADLGLTEADVAAEVSRPFWDRQVYNRHDHRRRFAPVRCRGKMRAEGGRPC